MKRSIIQMFVLVLAASAIGLAYNALSPSSLTLTKGREAPMESVGIQLMNLDEVRYYLDQGNTLIVDARSPEEYSLGHIEGALNLSAEDFENHWKALEPELKKAEMVITYCSGGSCGTSEEVALLLQKKGLEGVAVFTDGLPGWMTYNLAIKSGTEP